MTSIKAQAILNDAARRMVPVIDGMEKVFKGGVTDTVNNGTVDLPSLAKLIADANSRFDANSGQITADAVAAKMAAAASAADAAAKAVTSDARANDSASYMSAAQAASLTSVAAANASQFVNGRWPTTAAGLGQGVRGVTVTVPGSGGTNATYALGWSGGTQVLAPVGYFVVAGGAVVKVVVTYWGYYSAGSPTPLFTACPGLIGVTATADMHVNTDINDFFLSPLNAANDAYIIYQVTAGPVATEWSRLPASALAYVTDAKLKGLSLDSIFSDYIGTATPGAGSGTFASASTFWFQNPAKRRGHAFNATISLAAGATLKCKRCTRSGQVLTWANEISVTSTTGIVSIGPSQLATLDLQPDDYLAIYAPANSLRYTAVTLSDTPYFLQLGDNTTTFTFSGSPTTTNNIEARIDFYSVANTNFNNSVTAVKADALFDEQGQIISLGEIAPTDQATTLNTTATFFLLQSCPETTFISSIPIFSKIPAIVLFTLVKPKAGGGYTLLRKLTLKLAAGNNEPSYLDGSLPLIKAPRGSLFGILPLTASAIPYITTPIAAGDYNTSGEVTGDVTTLSQVFGRQVQWGVKLFAPSMKRKRERAQKRYLTDINMGIAGAIPAGCKSAGMTYSAGYATNTTTGLSSAYLEGLRSSNEARAKSRHPLMFTTASDKAACYRRPIFGLASVDAGSIGYIDAATNKIALTATWGGGSTLPGDATGAFKTCSFTIPLNVDLIPELTNDAKVITFKLTNPLTGESDSVSLFSSTTGVDAGQCFGVAGTAVLAGTVKVKAVQHLSLIYEPTDAAVGDSITESSAASVPANSWGYLLNAALGGKCIVSGDGGTKSDALLRRVREILIDYPTVARVWALIGANNATDGATGVTNFQNEMTATKALCDAYGVKLIVICPTPLGNGNQSYITQMRDYVLAQGWPTVRADLRLAVAGTNGVTFNPAKFAPDTVHPLDGGHADIADQCKIDQTEAFDYL
jgi:hypothetical protein